MFAAVTVWLYLTSGKCAHSTFRMQFKIKISSGIFLNNGTQAIQEHRSVLAIILDTWLEGNIKPQ